MKHLKRILALSFALLLLAGLAACGESDETVRTAEPVAYSGATITVARSTLAADYGLVQLMDSDVYRFSDADAVASPMKTDVAVVPLWRAAQMLESGEADIQILAVNTFGTYSVLTNGASVAGLKDLSGQTVYVGQAGAASEESLSRVIGQAQATLQALLEKSGVSAATENTVAENAFDMLLAGKVQIAVLPEPFASLAVAKNGAQAAFTLTSAWSDLGVHEPLVENCVVASTSFIKSNPDGVKKVLADLRASVEWVNLHPVDAVNLLIEKGLVDADVLHVDAELTEKKQESAKQQQAIDLIARSNAILMEGTAMISAAQASAVGQYELPDSAFYMGA